jgi:sigma-B regulation protein RsbU (phosphoserine phosphatase)
VKIPFHNSIVLKWACLVLVGASAVFLPLLVYLYTESRNIVLGEAERNARNLTRAVAAKIDQEFRAVEKTPENLALMVHRLKDRESVEDMLKRVTAGNKEIYGAALAFEPFAFEPALDRYAPYCYKTESGLAFIDLAVSYDYVRHDWYYIPRILKRPVWTEPYFDEGGGNILMATYSVPMFKNDPNGDPLGIVTADISLEKLGRLASGITVAKSGYCFIVSETGAFVSHPNPALVCRESVFSLSEETDRPELRRIGMLMLREPEGFEDAGTSMGRDSFIAFAKITSTNWVLAAVFPKAELLAEVEVLHTSALYCAIAGMGLLMGMSALMSFSMARRIRRMTPIAAKIGRGELDVDFERLSRKDDEIGRLAQAFAGMVQGLRDRDFIRDTFGRYLTKEVVNRLLESKDGLKLGGETREITIIMSDLRGFTSLTQTMPPTDVGKDGGDPARSPWSDRRNHWRRDPCVFRRARTDGRSSSTCGCMRAGNAGCHGPHQRHQRDRRFAYARDGHCRQYRRCGGG